VPDLGATSFVRRGRELPLELPACEPQRLDRVQPFRIANRLQVLLFARLLHLFLALLNPRLGVNQSFACITHE
jgi:hypothetical protein